MAVFLRDASSRLAGEALAARLSQARLRRRQALEINDNVVQGLVAAKYALDAEQYPVVATYIDRTLDSARAMMDDLLEPLDGEDLMPGDLVRANAGRHQPQDARSRVADDAPVTSGRAPSRRRQRVAAATAASSSSTTPTTCASCCGRGWSARPGFTVVGEAADGDRRGRGRRASCSPTWCCSTWRCHGWTAWRRCRTSARPSPACA